MIDYLESTFKEVAGLRKLCESRSDPAFEERVKLLAKALYLLFGVEEMRDALEDSSRFTGFALPNKLGQLPTNQLTLNLSRDEVYWLNPAELAISNLGDVVSIRTDANMTPESLDQTLALLKKYEFIYVPWEIMKQDPPLYITWAPNWWHVFFDFN